VNRPRSSVVRPGAEVAHLVARTHDDDNQVTMLCGLVVDGHTAGGSRLCGRCRQTFEDLQVEVRRFPQAGPS
jgi:hypothetical protein